MTLGDVQSALLANHQSEDKNDGSNGDTRHKTENGGDDAAQTQNKVDPTIHHRVARPSSKSLVDRMADVNNSPFTKSFI